MGRSRRRNKTKQKQQEKHKPSEHRGNDTTTTNTGDKYVEMITATGNFKMECYYAIQGLHDHHWNDDEKSLLKCSTDQEKQIERTKWRNCIADVLPSSFRFHDDLPKQLIYHLEKELHDILQQCCDRNHRSTNDNNIHRNNDTSTRTTTSMEQDDNNATNDVDKKNINIERDNNPNLVNDNDDDETHNEGNITMARRSNNTVYDVELLPKNPNDIIQRLDFLPHAYQLKFDKSLIRKHPLLHSLHEWLIQQTNNGYITRQETVSMIPPILLHPKATDMVLDMCAAPGSKTGQILEQLTNGGCIIANDNNAQRAYTLTHQLKRINMYNPVVLISCIDAQFFPSRYDMQFDSILCDVPCTGDGTTRKNINVWRSWSCIGALSLHTLQYQIAWKGISQLLCVHGYMCYSTCSLNPIENEAVVAEILRQGNGCIELVDCRQSSLTNFKTRPGMTSWKVLVEHKSKKQMKNERNKNNVKMQQKRQFYNSKTNQNHDDDVMKVVENEVAKGEMHDDDEQNNENQNDNNTNDTVVEVDEYTLDQQRTFGQKFQPTTYDENALLEMAMNVCGLKYYRTHEDVLATANNNNNNKTTSTANDNNHNNTFEEKRIKKSCFPPTDEENNIFHLERCVRCYPHDNDTGGFFVALLHKVAPISQADRKRMKIMKKEQPAETPEQVNNSNDDNNETARPEVKRPRMECNTKEESNENVIMDIPHGIDADEMNDTSAVAKNSNHRIIPITMNHYNEQIRCDEDNDNEPSSMKTNLLDGNDDVGNDDCVPISDEIIQPLMDYYGLDPLTFPRDQFMAKACAKEIKVIYYIAKPIKHLIDLGIQKSITVISTGLKGFAKNNRNNEQSVVNYRICQECVHYFIPHMTKRKIIVNENDFRTALATPGKTMHVSLFSNEMAEQVRILSTGSFVLIHHINTIPTQDNYQNTDEMQTAIPALSEQLQREKPLLVAAVMWKCRGDSIDTLVAKIDIDGILSMLNAMSKTNHDSSSVDMKIATT